MLLPGNLTDQEIQLIHLLRVDEEKLNAIEPETTGRLQQVERRAVFKIHCIKISSNFKTPRKS